MWSSYEAVPSALVHSNPSLTGEILTNLRTFDHGISVDESLSCSSTISFGILDFSIDQ
jgi:hypothetical protein